MAEGKAQHEVQILRADDTKHVEGSQPNINKNATTHRYQMIMEPALFGAIMAINIAQTSIQNFYLKTACTVDLGFPKNICDSGVGENFQIAEKDSQTIVSQVNISRSFVGSIIATVVLLFVGPWSDCSGRRKPLLIMPLLGMCVMSTAILLLLIFPGASTVQVLYAVQIPISLGGSFGLLITAAFSHIGDLCHATGRDVTRTIGAHRAAIQVAHVIGALSGPLLYRHLGFYGVIPVALLLQLSSLTYVVFVIKDVNVNRGNEVSVFNWRLPVNAVKCLVQKRQGHRRKIIFLIVFISMGDRIVLSAEVLLAYMFYRRKFNWDDVMFGSFLAYRNIISFLGTLLILTVLKRAMRLSDECVGILSCLSFILSASGLITAHSTVVVFVLPIIGIISQGTQVVQWPILNKQILPTEQGKIYSVMSALESATQTVSSPLYSLLYSRTVTTNPDIWLIPGIILAFLQLASFFCTRNMRKASEKEENAKAVKELTLIKKKNSRIVIDDSEAERMLNQDIILVKTTEKSTSHGDVISE